MNKINAYVFTFMNKSITGGSSNRTAIISGEVGLRDGGTYRLSGLDLEHPREAGDVVR